MWCACGTPEHVACCAPRARVVHARAYIYVKPRPFTQYNVPPYRHVHVAFRSTWPVAHQAGQAMHIGVASACIPEHVAPGVEKIVLSEKDDEKLSTSMPDSSFLTRRAL